MRNRVSIGQEQRARGDHRQVAITPRPRRVVCILRVNDRIFAPTPKGMAMNQPPELTTRDVLQQVDRRLELIEGDQRNLNHKVDRLDDKVDDRFTAQETKADARFRWTVGLILMSWMSMMGTILFRLGPLTP